MTQATTALATREMTLQDIARRIELNKQSGWGLEKGSPAQLNMVALFCQKHQLLPGDDVTLYEGKPWLTIDGRVKLMRRHKDEYRGHSTRPLARDEKEAWGYDPDDLVIEATIRTVTYGEIKARGKVSKAERMGTQVQGTRNNPVAKHHPVEIAEKRALSRAERYTFGTESFIDDEDAEEDVRTVIEERNDPEQNALNAASYERIFGSDQTATVFDAPAPRPGTREAAMANPAELDRQIYNLADQEARTVMVADGARVVDAETGEVLGQQAQPVDEWTRNRELVAKAAKLKLTGVPTLPSRSAQSAVKQANDDLEGRIRAYEAGAAAPAEPAQQATAF
jgi:hypothetical protein